MQRLMWARSARSALKRDGLRDAAEASSDFGAERQLQTQIHAARSGGRTLPDRERRFFERHLHADLSGVRIHAGPHAASAAQTLHAQAFTHGQDVFFGQGVYQPATERGKRLLAHELTHTLQQRGDYRSLKGGQVPSIQRAPSDEAPKESEANDDLYVGLVITTETDVTPGGYSEYEGVVDLTTSSSDELLDGDVFMLVTGYDSMGRWGDKPKIASWSLPPELEKVQDVDASGVQLRVASGPLAGEPEKIVEVTLLREGSGRQIVVRLKLTPLPAQPDAVHAELEQTEAELAEVRRERTQKREKFHDQRREARQKFHALDRPERRAQREQFREEQAKRREAWTDERGSLGDRARELREKRRTLRRANSCSLSTQQTIEKALGAAVQVTNAAASKMAGAGLADPAVSAALSRFMKWSPGGSAALSGDALVQRVVDTLMFARNNMLLVDHSSFQCGSVKCDETTGAFTQRGSGRGDIVTVCHGWTRGSISFGVTSGIDEARAYALLHEFVHLAGPQAENETYVHKRGEWEALTHEQALEMADAYAALAWTLAG